MIRDLNQHKYLDMLEIQETYKDCLKVVIAEAGVSDTALKKTLDESTMKC